MLWTTGWALSLCVCILVYVPTARCYQAHGLGTVAHAQMSSSEGVLGQKHDEQAWVGRWRDWVYTIQTTCTDGQMAR